MRLLHAETRTLHQFFGDDIPPYAALSHTWEAQELTFDDIPRSGSVPSNLKIDGCCEQTLAYHFKWVWIDTICIDKSSSAELTEAINSMYAWYERSKLCFAYLSDVEATVDLTSPGSEFYRSRWFTRGWTLQELVAPATVLFFNKHWKYVGSKGKLVGAADLTPILARITRVPQDVLRRNASRKSVSIASRMTWAAGRRTTRIEDMAYCLLGIFDVNLPMLYGEGSRAFLRLQEEIIRNSDDESIFAWGFDQLIADSFRLRGRAQVNASTLLASSPADFAGCRNLRPLSAHHSWFKSYYSTHYAMTNKGLLIERPI
ncbi:heterokaryon incompatibility protein-domain-containing protein, partial [Echria macrotheca]